VSKTYGNSDVREQPTEGPVGAVLGKVHRAIPSYFLTESRMRDIVETMQGSLP
jgi:hypothetical protein